jgi:hypothetical protein
MPFGFSSASSVRFFLPESEGFVKFYILELKTTTVGVFLWVV